MGKNSKIFRLSLSVLFMELKVVFLFFLRKVKIEKKERIKARIDAVRRRFNLFEMAVLRKIEIYVSSSSVSFL